VTDLCTTVKINKNVWRYFSCLFRCNTARNGTKLGRFTAILLLLLVLM